MHGRHDAHFAANRANWDDRARIHIRDEAGYYGIERLVAGDILLTPIERGELGPVEGLRVAHFQCHIGTDTLSLVRLGARVTGLDFSPASLAEARRLSERTGLAATFVEGSVFNAPALIGTGFDLVYTTWGTIVWLPDIDAWARAVAGVLRPGGRLYFTDTHPVVGTFDEKDARVQPVFDYGTPIDRPQRFEGELSYDGSQTRIANTTTYEWLHSASSVLNALIDAGLTIERVTEHFELPWMMVHMMVPLGNGLYGLPQGHPRLPLAWSIKAVKTA